MSAADNEEVNAVISGGSRIFPRGGVNPPGGGREPSRGGVNTPNFPENCMKSKEFGRPGGGRASLTPPLDPPMVMNSELCDGSELNTGNF